MSPSVAEQAMTFISLDGSRVDASRDIPLGAYFGPLAELASMRSRSRIRKRRRAG